MFIRKSFIAAALATLVAPAAINAQATEPYIGEVIIVPYNFCPRNYAEANGQILAINQNTALFSLLGTFYGGNGVNTFALPDLRGRTIMHSGQGPGLTSRSHGEPSGMTSNILTTANLPPHSHNAAMRANTLVANANDPAGNSIARAPRSNPFFSTSNPDVDMRVGDITVSPTVAGVPFQKTSPYLAMRHCIALSGIFPSRN